MAFDIIIGRNESDRKKFGDKGVVFLGKAFVQMGRTTSLSNRIFVDVVRSHVILVAGKRGGGKCLHGDSLITLGNGKVIPIKDIAHNTQDVMALDHDLKIKKFEKTAFFKREVNNLIYLKLMSGKEIKLTPEHPLLTTNGWKAANALDISTKIATQRQNTALVNQRDTAPEGIYGIDNTNNWHESAYWASDQRLMQITKIKPNKLRATDIFWDEIVNMEELNGKFTVYDITVPDVHNFIANGIIVHNSYSLGVLSEGMSSLPEEVSSNIAVVIFDTMGIYWTMKHANLKDEDLLKEWGIKPEALSTVKIYTPKGYYQEYLDKKLPTDAPFSIRPGELTAEDWVLTFEIGPSDPVSIIIEKIIYNFHEQNNMNYSIDDIINAIENDKETDQNTKNAAKNRFRAAKGWGLFDTDAENIQSIVKGGQVTVLDVSVYSTSEGGWGVKNLVVGLVAKKLFIQRMVARKLEEVEMMEKGFSYLGFEEEKENKYPMVWLILDEAHEALPQSGKTAATDPLVTILREGRQPGVSLILATQQPGMIHHDVITQTDIVLSHRLTAKTDIEALNSMMQSYMLTGITQYMNELPRDKGSAIILDDTSERIYPLKVRPRISWHGGEAPTALKQRRKLDLS